jgi:hypothetical protein
MLADEYQALVESIKINGLLHDIELIDDKIIDGRHRERACIEVGETPRYKEIETDSPMSYAVAANINRRHLLVGQKAMLAIPIEEMFAKEAMARQSRRAEDMREVGVRGTGNRPVFGKLGKKPQTQDENIENRSITRAGKLLGIGPATVQRAKKVYHDAPDLVKLVESGEMTVGAAYDQAMLREGRGRLAETAAPRGKASSKGPKGPDEKFSIRLTKLNNDLKALIRDFKRLDPNDVWRTRYVAKLDMVNDNLRLIRGMASKAVVTDEPESDGEAPLRVVGRR